MVNIIVSSPAHIILSWFVLGYSSIPLSDSLSHQFCWTITIPLSLSPVTVSGQVLIPTINMILGRFALIFLTVTNIMTILFLLPYRTFVPQTCDPSHLQMLMPTSL